MAEIGEQEKGKSSLRIMFLGALLGMVVVYGIMNRHGITLPGHLTSSYPRQQMDEPDRNKEVKSPCTFALLRKYYGMELELPGDGVMVDIDRQFPYFEPSICKFNHHWIGGGGLSKCVRNGHIKSIMTAGDSNAGRYFQTLCSIFNGCKQTAHEQLKEKGFVPDATYYTAFTKDKLLAKFVTVTSRSCSGCAGQRYACNLSGSDQNGLLLEHLPMTRVVEKSISMHVPLKDNHEHDINKVGALTSQEFLFRYFLKGRYPDIFLVFLPFNHDKWHSSEKLRVDIKYFHSLVKLYFPPTTKVMYIPTFSEFEKKRGKGIYVNMTFHGMLATEKIDQLNHVMFDVLKNRLLNSTSNTYSFFDMVNITRPLERWSLDGVHMKPVWYKVALSMILETLCNSIEMNAL